MSISKKQIVRSRWPEEELKVFGKEGTRGLDVARRVQKELLSNPAKLLFIANSEFETLISDVKQDEKDKVKYINSVYWKEICYRSHFAASTSLLRNLSWISGVTVVPPKKESSFN